MTDKSANGIEEDERAIVAFLDILGTSERVRQGTFGRVTAHDFVNPVGLVARLLPRLRFAAFSDSVLISAKLTDASDFLSAIAFIHRHWF